MRDIAVCVNNDNENVTIYDTIDAIKEAGFKNVFVQWYDENWEVSQEEQVKYVKENGLNIIFAHLGYQNINDIWIEEETNIVERYKNDIYECYKLGIPMVIMHLTSKKIVPPFGEIGLKRIKEIIEYAEKLNIKVAFENLRLKGYLEYVIENIDSDSCGICFDSGHFHAFFEDNWDINCFKNRVIAVHLHDNDSTYDQHLLPFDGTNDWNNIVNKLKNVNYSGPVTLEICYMKDYIEKMTLKEFYQKGFEIGCDIAKMFD